MLTTRSNPSLPTPELQAELQRIYNIRFSGVEAYRNAVWRTLVSEFFSRWIKPADAVLDLGCGYGEFINNVNTAEKFAIDLNPRARECVSGNTRLFEQDSSAAWPLADNILDVIFSSNFFEHLPTKAALQATLLEAHRCLRPGALILALGPNFKFLSGAYWDFFDHHLALTDRSLSEVLVMTGFEIVQDIPKFLPYTMSQGFRPPIWLLRAYLRMPALWKIFGRQFLVVARKPR